MGRDLEPRRRGGTLQSLDKVALVAVGVVAVLVVLKIIGFIAGTIFFLMKLALAAAIVLAAFRFLTRTKRS